MSGPPPDSFDPNRRTMAMRTPSTLAGQTYGPLRSVLKNGSYRISSGPYR